MPEEIVPKLNNFNIIRHHNSPHSAVLNNGKTVRRHEKIFIKPLGTFIPCAPYDNHFIFETKVVNYPAHQCTCGSMAIVVGPFGYLRDASLNSPDGRGENRMLVCYSHATTGRHADGNT